MSYWKHQVYLKIKCALWFICVHIMTFCIRHRVTRVCWHVINESVIILWHWHWISGAYNIHYSLIHRHFLLRCCTVLSVAKEPWCWRSLNAVTLVFTVSASLRLVFNDSHLGGLHAWWIFLSDFQCLHGAPSAHHQFMWLWKWSLVLNMDITSKELPFHYLQGSGDRGSNEDHTVRFNLLLTITDVVKGRKLMPFYLLVSDILRFLQEWWRSLLQG